MLGLLSGRLCGEAVITSVGELRGHTPVALQDSPVRLAGVVTYLRDTAEDFNFILDDGTGGVMVYPKPRPEARLLPGQQLRVEGTVQGGKLLLSVHASKIYPEELGQLPKPIPATLAEVLAGAWDGRLVEITEVVRAVRKESAELRPQRLALDLGPQPQRVVAWVSHWEGSEHLYAAGRRVKLRAVAIRWHNGRGQPLSTSLLINSPADAISLPPASQIAVQPLASILRTTSRDVCTTQGVVSYLHAGLLFLQQDGCALRVHLGSASEAAVPGSLVEVSGFPVMGSYSTELEDAWFRRLGVTAKPVPLEFSSASELLDRSGIVDRDAAFVSLTGELRAVRERDGQRALELTSAGHDFTAWYPLEAELAGNLQPGALVQATGGCTLILSPEARRLGHPPDQFSIAVEGPQSLRVLRTAPWWTYQRVAVLLAALTVLVASSLLWVTFLRRRNTLLSNEIRARQLAESRLANERRRVAADLHDTLEQTLLATKLQLSTAARSQPVKPSLTLAQHLLAKAQQEVREAVWDLHLQGTEPISLAALLAKTCAESALHTGLQISFHTEGDASAIPAITEAQSLRVVREAITNAVKHAQASCINVCCNFTPAQLMISVTDDGIGFDQTRAPGPEAGHFGLTSMTERIQRLAGTLSIQSTNHGTCVQAHIPISPA